MGQHHYGNKCIEWQAQQSFRKKLHLDRKREKLLSSLDGAVSIDSHCSRSSFHSHEKRVRKEEKIELFYICWISIGIYKKKLLRISALIWILFSPINRGKNSFRPLILNIQIIRRCGNLLLLYRSLVSAAWNIEIKCFCIPDFLYSYLSLVAY